MLYNMHVILCYIVCMISCVCYAGMSVSKPSTTSLSRDAHAGGDQVPKCVGKPLTSKCA